MAVLAAWMGKPAEDEHVQTILTVWEQMEWRGYTPLHLGMEKQAPAEAITAVLAACPDAAKEKTKYGKTPLRIGMENKAPADAITAVLTACPDAAKEKDKDGNTPLHLGMWKQAPAEAIATVLAAWRAPN